MDVALIQWPSDESLRVELAELGQPRLLLVDSEADAPLCIDVLEDWVRLPVSRDDRNARIETLLTRAGATDPDVPSLNGNGTLEYHDRTTQLSAIQADLAHTMIQRFGAVVSREALAAAAWPGADATDNNLDVTIGRLRRQIEPVGLRIRTVRSRGYLLTSSGLTC
jgi:DNA-binding response OmpR family regulator